MKRILLPVALLAFALPLALGSAVAQTTTTKKPTTTAAAPKGATLEQELRTFSNWVDEKLEMNLSVVRLDWGRLQSDYARMTKRLDAAADSLPVQSKREYLGQKARYKAWAAEQGHPVEEPLPSATADGRAGTESSSSVDDAQRKLLSTSSPINRARAGDLPELYSRLVESVRTKRSRWTRTDWDNASLVLNRLNTRYEQVHDQLQIEDRARIRTLQAEFRVLEKAQDAKGILDGL
ncbi:hypothetical protein LJY25_17050 [Hymenobacter sp. BT175]|uniref:hypothetical protein n=1 Tax=Hymenobacter translucens TaxID=2886507 RepID=UPI001D0E7667|nr:hypothetical protein [Hymenobacter translucens]MCC2548160.1 hypothetical protein [Hymenobacter translucens]